MQEKSICLSLAVGRGQFQKSVSQLGDGKTAHLQDCLSHVRGDFRAFPYHQFTDSAVLWVDVSLIDRLFYLVCQQKRVFSVYLRQEDSSLFIVLPIFSAT